VSAETIAAPHPAIRFRIRARAVLEIGAIFVAIAMFTVPRVGPEGVGWAATAVGVVIATTVTHETGHALAARLLRVRVHALTVRGVLSAYVTRDRVRDRRADVAICLAGPAVTVTELIAGLLVVDHASGISRFAVDALLVASLAGLTGSVLPWKGTDVRRAWDSWRQGAVPTRLVR
jgi:hypothetical protein